MDDSRCLSVLLTFGWLLLGGCAFDRDPGLGLPAGATTNATLLEADPPIGSDGQSDSPSPVIEHRAGSRISPASASGGTSTKAAPEGDRPSADQGASANDSQAVNAEEMQKILAELQAVGAVDPEIQAELFASLKQTDPQHWPLIARTFRMAIQAKRPAPQEDGTNATGETPQQPDMLARAQHASSDPPLAAQQTIPRIEHQGAKPAVGLKPEIRPSLAEPTVAQLSFAPTLGPGGETQIAHADTSGVSAPPSLMAATPAGAAQPMPTRIDTATVATSSATVGSASNTAQVASPNVAPASHQIASAAATPEQQLQELIHSLEAATQEAPRTTADITRHAHLRMLYLLANRREDALRPIAGIPAAEQDFWTREMYALDCYLDATAEPSLDRRATEAAVHLEDARRRLAELGSLVVKNLAFCVEVNSYGVYTEFEKTEFEPAQEFVLYAELENFKSESTPDGYRTALRSSYQIFDAQGHRVAQRELSINDETCRNPRRDFFIPYLLTMPERIYPGQYTLQLTIVDSLTQKIGQASIDFTIKEQ